MGRLIRRTHDIDQPGFSNKPQKFCPEAEIPRKFYPGTGIPRKVCPGTGNPEKCLVSKIPWDILPRGENTSPWRHIL